MTNQEQILADIKAERDHQDDLWGDQTHKSQETWIAILVEEVGEVARAVLDEQGLQHTRDELVQVAAVSVAYIEKLDKELQERVVAQA